MARSIITAADYEAARSWVRVNEFLIENLKRRNEYIKNCDALGDIILGKSIRVAAKDHGLNRTTLTQIVQKAFSNGIDGRPNGYRACIPYHVRFRATDCGDDVTYPNDGGPYAVTRVRTLYPEIAGLLDNCKMPLPRGRLPAAFKRLVQEIRRFLREKGHGNQWPFTSSDKGRRAFATHVRDRREAEAKLGAEQFAAVNVSKLKRLADLFELFPIDRGEFDEHAFDDESELRLPNTIGEIVDVPLSKKWGLFEVDANSESLFVWTMVFGKFTALDVAQCFAKSLRKWTPRELIVPDMHYQEGAMMPSNLPCGPTIPRMIGLDNHMTHRAKIPILTWATQMDTVFNVGKRHTPQDRPYIEGFNKWFENNLVRELPGGNEPAKGRDDKKYTSAYKSKNHPIHVQAYEDVMDVCATEFNVTGKSSKYQKSPIDIMLRYELSDQFWMPALIQDDALKKLTSEVRKVTLRGTRRKGESKVVHVNIYHVRYRCQALDNKFELIGNSYHALIDLEDLRTITLVDDTFEVFATLVAERPWNVTQHDLTTRRAIRALARKGDIDLEATHCAISAYAAFTLANAGKNKAVADQAARLIQLSLHGKLQPPLSSHNDDRVLAADNSTRRVNRFNTLIDE